MKKKKTYDMNKIKKEKKNSQQIEKNQAYLQIHQLTQTKSLGVHYSI